MCERCDNKVVAKRWAMWAGIVLTFLLFLFTQVFMYGKAMATIENHIESDPTHRELTDEFVGKDEFETMKEMIFYLYKKEGGR